MLFRQLEYFVAVASERHFARAAEKCFVSQPALSAAIAKLERELNVTLINRGRSFEGLTPEGERLVVWARRILAEHDAFKAEVDAVRSGITGTSGWAPCRPPRRRRPWCSRRSAPRIHW